MIISWRAFISGAALIGILSSCARRQVITVPMVTGTGAIAVTQQNPEFYPLNEYTVQKCFYEIASTGLRDPTNTCPIVPTEGTGKAVSRPAPLTPKLPQGADNSVDTEFLTPKANDSVQAKKLRNAIVFGLMTDIDLVYNHEYNNLFVRKNLSATIGDGITLGLGATGAIAAAKATKTIMAALQTAFTGLNASISKNYFSEQSFQVLGMAMGTRRDKVRKGILEGLTQDDTLYPLNQAKRDLISYVQAGTLPAALEELQEEAGVASRKEKTPDNATVITAVPTGLGASKGILTNALVWQPVSGASAYTVYWSLTSPVTKQSAKLVPVTVNDALDKRSDVSEVFYAVTASVSGHESDLSSEANARPIGLATAANADAQLAAPSNIRATVISGGTVVITFDAPANSDHFIVNSSSLKDGSNPTTVGGPTESNLVLVTDANAAKRFYQVIAVNKNQHNGTASGWVSTAGQTPVEKNKPSVSLF
jgi:hypothetical protein